MILLIVMLKKLALSLFVLGTFTAYAIHLRTDDEEHAPIVMITPVPTSETVVNVMPSPIATQTPRSKYKDGSYIGIVADAFYGPLQVKAIIKGGKLTDVQFLQYPNDRRTSEEINQQAMPFLKQEAIIAQNAQVDGVSGATQTSAAFIESLGTALNQAI